MYSSDDPFYIKTPSVRGMGDTVSPSDAADDPSNPFETDFGDVLAGGATAMSQFMEAQTVVVSNHDPDVSSEMNTTQTDQTAGFNLLASH